VAVFSPKGGAGTSSLAANLAVALRQLTNKKVALVDGNLALGDIGVIMNLVSTKTIADLANRIGELDRELLNDVLTTHPTQVRVLLAPPNPQTGELVSAEHVKTILELMRREFDFVVVDTQSSFGDKALAVLDTSDRIVTLMTLEMTSIKNIKLFLEVADLLEYNKDKIVLVLNKADPRFGIRVDNVEENIRHKVTMQVGNAGYEMSLAVNQGVPLVVDKRNHQTSKDIFALANLLSSTGGVVKAGEKPAEKPAENRGLLGRFLQR
jgi:pilus assembly protein CpaE